MQFLQSLLPTMAPEGASGAAAGTPSPTPAPAPGGPAPGDGGQPAPSPTPSPTKPTRPDGLEDKFWDADKGVKWADLNGHLSQLSALKAEADIIAQGIPDAPEGYKFSLEGFQVPEGFKLNENDPRIAAGRAVAHKHNLTQEGFSDFVKMVAQGDIDRQKDFQTRQAEALKPLGDAKDTRIAAVKTALTGRLGKSADAITPLLFSAPIVEAFESLLRQTPAAAPGAGAGAGEAKPEWNKLSPNAKWATAYENAERNKQRTAA